MCLGNTHTHNRCSRLHTSHCLQCSWGEQSHNITVWDWTRVRWTPSRFPATLTCLTSHYSKLIMSPQVSYLSVCFTKTSSAEVPLNLVNICANQFLPSAAEWLRDVCPGTLVSASTEHQSRLFTAHWSERMYWRIFHNMAYKDKF